MWESDHLKMDAFRYGCIWIRSSDLCAHYRQHAWPPDLSLSIDHVENITPVSIPSTFAFFYLLWGRSYGCGSHWGVDPMSYFAAGEGMRGSLAAWVSAQWKESWPICQTSKVNKPNYVCIGSLPVIITTQETAWHSVLLWGLFFSRWKINKPLFPRYF